MSLIVVAGFAAVPILIALVFVTGSTIAFQNTALQPLQAEIVGPERLGNAISLTSFGQRSIGVVGARGLAARPKGFSTGEPSFVTPLDYSRLLYATALGIFIFGETPDAWSVMGAVIIVASGTYITRRELALTRARRHARGG